MEKFTSGNNSKSASFTSNLFAALLGSLFLSLPFIGLIVIDALKGR